MISEWKGRERDSDAVPTQNERPPEHTHHRLTLARSGHSGNCRHRRPSLIFGHVRDARIARNVLRALNATEAGK